MTTMQKVYMDAQAACGIAPGDWVRVVSAEVLGDSFDWMSFWNRQQLDMLGGVFQVKSLDVRGVWLEKKDVKDRMVKYAFPYFVLEKTDPPAQPCPFKPFDRVLVKERDDSPWQPEFFSSYDPEEEKRPYHTIGAFYWSQCIPYEGNEDLAFTTKAPEEA